MTSLESLGRELDREAEHTVITVGRLEVHPNALNVIPGRVRFSIDFPLSVGRRSSRAVRKGFAAQLLQIASARGLDIEIACTEKLPVVPMDRRMCDMLRDAARRLDLRLPDVKSGALHDTAILAPFLPSAMLFVASKDGISHNPAEFSRIEHIALAARVLVEAFRA